jgi:hypothetical protein
MQKMYVLSLFLLFLAAVDLLPSVLLAKEEEIWNPPSVGPVTAWIAPLCGSGKYTIIPRLFFSNTTGSYDTKSAFTKIETGSSANQSAQLLFGMYGITDKLEADVQLTYMENYAKNPLLSVSSSGLGDSLVYLRYCFAEENGALPHITAITQVKFPTGKYQYLDPAKSGTDYTASSTGGAYDYGAGVVLTKSLRPFKVHLDSIYSIPAAATIDGVKTQYGNYINSDLAFELFLPAGFNLLGELNYFSQSDIYLNGVKSPSSGSNSLILSPGIGWSTETVQFLITYMRTLSGKNTDSVDSFVLSSALNY